MGLHLSWREKLPGIQVVFPFQKGQFTQEIFGLCPQEIIEENYAIFVETLAARQLNSLPYEQRLKVVRYSTGIPAFSTVIE